MVPKAGLEPAWISPHAPQTCVSTSSTTSAQSRLEYYYIVTGVFKQKFVAFKPASPQGPVLLRPVV